MLRQDNFGAGAGSYGQLRRIPEDYIGGPVASEVVVHVSNGIAVLVRHIAAFPDGFSFLLALRQVQVPQNWFKEIGEFLGGAMRPSKDKLPVRKPYFAVAFADGTVIDSGHSGMPGDAPYLEFQGGGGTDGYVECHVWCPRLPSRGHVRFRFSWPAKKVALAEGVLDGRLLRSAARNARPLWDSDA
jgi:hypothetical protein